MEQVEIFVDHRDIVHIGQCDIIRRGGRCEVCSLSQGVEFDDGHTSACVVLPAGSVFSNSVVTPEFAGELYFAPAECEC